MFSKLCVYFLFSVFTNVFAGVIVRDGPCTPGELVWVDCNLCTCNRQGQPNPVCAAMWCQPAPKNKPLEENNDVLPEM